MSITRVFWCLLIACLVILCAGFWLHDGEAPAPAPSLASANQVTHDGLAKTAVLSDGSDLYVAEEKGGHQSFPRLIPTRASKRRCPRRSRTSGHLMWRRIT